MYQPSELDSEELLFRLMPFASDIDVEHSGPRELNARVHEELIASLPAGASIRLEIRTEADSAVFTEARRFQAFAPVLSMSLSSDGFRDPEGGALDVARRKYRFRPNDRYKESPLYREGKDIEIFSMLLYFKALLEDGASPAENFLRELERAKADIKVPQKAYLNSRLFYLLAAIWGVSHPKEEGRELLRAAALDYLFSLSEAVGNQNLPNNLSEILASGRALIISSWLGGKSYRFPMFTVSQFFTPEHAESALRNRQCASNQRCFLESPWFDVSQGVSDCTVKQTSFGMEFVHLLLQLPDDCEGLSEEEITACWLLKGESRHDKKYEELILPTPNVCHILNQDEKQRLSVRCNLLDLGGLTAAFTDVRAKIFLLRPETS
jgi:hypothetical protein